MQIIHTHAPHMLNQLAYAFFQDAESWKDWQCGHIFHTDEERIAMVGHPPDPWNWKNAPSSMATNTAGQDKECTIFLCPGGDILVLTQGLPDVLLRDLMEKTVALLRTRTGHSMSMERYNVASHASMLASLCYDKASRAPGNAGMAVDSLVQDQASSGDTLLGDAMEGLEASFEAGLSRRRFRAPAHVLLVEDDALTRRIAVRLLKPSYRLITAASAEEAVMQYMLHAPDIVFLDINLPDFDGFSVLQALTTRDPEAFVVMFSSHGYLENLANALQQGAKGFITKPFRQEQLHHYIHESDVA